MILDAEYYDKYWADWSAVRESSAGALALLRAVPGVEVLIDESKQNLLIILILVVLLVVLLLLLLLLYAYSCS
jgi:hypothetical protein